MATQPTLAMIPSGYKDGKLYSVLPSDGVGDFDVTRGSNATRINKNGLIETVTGNTPRLDYTGGGCPSLLLEPQRTNLIPYSEDFSNAYWTKSGSSVTSGFISPTGGLDAFKLVEDTSNGQHRLIVGVSSYSTVHTLSAFFKPIGTNRKAYLDMGIVTGYFDFTTKVFTSATGVGSYEEMSDGWYKLSLTSNSAITLTAIYLGLADSNETYLGDGTSGVYIFGAQVEQGSYATSYIKSNSGSATSRLADTANNAGNASTFNDSEGVLMVEISALADSLSYRLISLSGGGTANTLFIGYSQTSNQIHSSVISGGSVQVSWFHSLSSTTENIKCALKYKDNDFALWVNGVNVLTDTSGISPTGLNSLGFSLGSGSFPFYGNCEDLRVYNTALTALELETLTSYTSFNAMALALNYTIQ